MSNKIWQYLKTKHKLSEFKSWKQYLSAILLPTHYGCLHHHQKATISGKVEKCSLKRESILKLIGLLNLTSAFPEPAQYS